MSNIVLIFNKKVSKEIRYSLLDLSNMIDCDIEKNFDYKKNLKFLKKYMFDLNYEKCVFLEIKKKICKLWFTFNNKSYKFNIINVKSINFLKFNEKFHKHSGYITMFSSNFDLNLKTLFENIFSSNTIKKERAIIFYQKNEYIYISHFNLETKNEIGPRIVLELEKVLDDYFCGRVLFDKKINLNKK